MQEKSNFFSIIISLLIIIAVIFIYLNYSKIYGGSTKNNGNDNIISSPVERITFSTSKGNISVSPKGPTPEDMQKFNDRINALAEDISEIVVGGCKANPSIVRIKKNDTMIFRNGDSKEVIIVFNGKQIKIPFRGEEKVAMDFLTPGIHGFGCSLTESTVIGFVLVVE